MKKINFESIGVDDVETFKSFCEQEINSLKVLSSKVDRYPNERADQYEELVRTIYQFNLAVEKIRSFDKRSGIVDRIIEFFLNVIKFLEEKSKKLGIDSFTVGISKPFPNIYVELTHETRG
jgi:hypothetical protein